MSAISQLHKSVLLVSASLLLVPLAGIAQSATPTFNTDVAPILFNNCVSCHRTGEIGPMPLTSYAEAAPFAGMIAHYTTNRIMPPWGADHTIGKFSNDPSLSEQEISIIAAWAAGGSPEGNAADLPLLPSFNSDWRMGSPDITLRNPDAFTVEPTARSVYQDAMISTGFAVDTFIQGTEVRPGLVGFTHHANVFAQLGEEEERVAGYTPGGASRQYPPGVAKLIPAGTQLRLNMHYNPKGMQHTDPGAEFAFKFAEGPIRQIAYTAQSSNNSIDIPPGEANYELTGRPFVFEEDSHIISFMPRMNERGKDITYTLIHPDGREQVLLSVPKFQYLWIFTYELETPIAAPAGSRLVSTAHWDNSAANPFNPDPTENIKFGPEILNAYFEYTLDAQDLSGTNPALSSSR